MAIIEIEAGGLETGSPVSLSIDYIWRGCRATNSVGSIEVEVPILVLTNCPGRVTVFLVRCPESLAAQGYLSFDRLDEILAGK